MLSSRVFSVVVDHYDPAPAARLLAAAWQSGVQMAELPAGIRPRSMHEGYDVQDAFVGMLGDSVAGWKLGVGSPSAMRKAGNDRPLIGRVLRSQCYRSGDTVKLHAGSTAVIEFEIAFILANDIPPGAAPRSPMQAVRAVHVTFEVVQSRFVDRRAVGWPSFVADNSAFRALVVGSAIDPTSMGVLADDALVRVDGSELARGLAGDEITDPIASLQALFLHAEERRITLQRDAIVSTGSVSTPFNVTGRSALVEASSAGAEIAMRIEAA